MAPGGCVKNGICSMQKSWLLLLTGIGLTFLLSACASTESSTEDSPSTEYGELSDRDLADEYRDEELNDTEQLLLRTRSSLSNHYSGELIQIPEVYLKEIVIEEQERDPYAGFRVQLISTRNVSEADSLRDHFVAWADSVISGYAPDAYVDFRSPNYRVRAGDFQNRDKAIHFSGLLKSRYPDAWVVHERIEPSNVPADTSQIRLKSLQEIELDREMQMIEGNESDGESEN